MRLIAVLILAGVPVAHAADDMPLLRITPEMQEWLRDREADRRDAEEQRRLKRVLPQTPTVFERVKPPLPKSIEQQVAEDLNKGK